MGNQLLKGYTIQGQPISGVGCEKIWRVYHGHKQNTNTMATIFAIEKRNLPKGQRDDLIQFAKRQAMSLARIRHPGVLAISEALIQDEQIMAFSTQQIQGNLTMLAKQNKLKEIISNQIQLRLNLFPLLDTVQFLHENVKTVHLGLNFDNIYITKEGKWKISGFSNSQIYGGEGLQQLKNFKCSNYYFCPPQMVVQKKYEKRSDVYEFGILILDLLLVLTGKYEAKAYKTQGQYTQNFQADLLKKINSDSLQKTENYRQLKMLLKNVLARQPQKRASLHQLSTSKWLNDKLVLTVRYLQNITNYDNKQQIQFLKGLMGILNHFQSRILTRKVLPLLLDLLKFKHLIPSVIYICLEIIKNGKILSQAQFRDRIWPSLKKVVQGKQMTAHSLYLFVDNMEKIQKVIGMQQLNQYIVPLYVKCFDCPAKLKQLALHKTDYILNKMDYQFVKTKMIPKVMNCIKDQNSQIYKKSLIALRKSIKILDTQTVTSIVLPGLQACKKSGSDPFVNAITVSIYGMLGKNLPSQTLCAKLIPTILPYLSDPNVGPQDFYNYKAALSTMLDKIESQRKKYWDQSQISQGPSFTQKDFQFQDESKKNPVLQSTIGKGDYNFLSNYNSNQRSGGQNQSSLEPQQDLQKKNSDFNSPFNFDTPKVNQPQQQSQYQPQNQPQSQVNKNQGGSSFNLGFSQMNQNTSNKNQMGFGNFSGNSGLNSLGGFGGMGSLNTNTWNQPKMQLSNQPISPQTRQNMPKLKGPDASSLNQIKIKKPQPFQQQQQHHHQYEMNLDPWASIQLGQSPTLPVYNEYSHNSTNTYTNANTNTNTNTNTNLYNNTWNYPTTTPSNPYTASNTTNKVNNNFGGNFAAFNDDPFADIDKGNTGLNMNMNSMGMNMNMNMNTNLNLVQPKVNNQFNYGENSNYNFSNPSQNTHSYNLNTNMGLNTNLTTLGGYGNTSVSSPNKNLNTFSFDMGIGGNNINNKNNNNSGFDLI